MTDLFRRLRWGNLARLAAVVLAIALVFAWPRLHAGAEPSLPPAAAAPLDTTPVERPRTTVPDKAETAAKPRTRRTKKTTPRPRRAKPRRAKRRRAKPRRSTPAATATAPTLAAPTYVPPAAPAPPAGAEFRP
jgi:hypothetical protein